MGSLPDDTVLSVTGLTTHFPTEGGIVRSVESVDVDLRRGETVAIVGESGSGKSVMCLSVMGLVDRPGRVVDGQILFRRRTGEIVDLGKLSEDAMQRLRGDEIAMIFQEPMTSLNPLYTVGDQIAEAIVEHRGVARKAAWDAAIDLLREVGIADPARRADDYPHTMSGGMRQRVMIAMALACSPAVLIADEPTTALDVTIQAQILELLRGLKASAANMGILFVTHNMGVVAEMADRVVVMYAGRVVESGAVRDVFAKPLHPYTRGLLASMAVAGRRRDAQGRRIPLAAIPGNVPNPLELPAGCAFAPRCAMARAECNAAMPPLIEAGVGRASRCFLWSEM
ncbi:MAG: ABC transporter ATP-binding protein [Telmatospirillum sp.]|nr:ABC transporter ATP-binding protein [Telmatospirillum sp.]